MGLHSQRILAQAGFSGVFFAAKILRGELPRYRLPLPEFAANVIPCSPLMEAKQNRKLRSRFSCTYTFSEHTRASDAQIAGISKPIE